MYIVRFERKDDLILRVDGGAGPFANTELSLTREAEVYLALRNQSVPIARLHGITPKGDALLMDRVAGTHDLSTLDLTDRVSICDRFIDALAELHRIDVTQLDLPSFRRPAGERDHAMQELDLWNGIMTARVKRRVALGDCAFSILRDLAPRYSGPTVLCHGDVGPKNFMFDRGEISALIDWENAHLGDPMDDLAWWVFRGNEWLSAPGSLPQQLRRWSQRSGLPLDADRIVYYRALVLLRWYVCILAALESASAVQDRFPYLSLVPTLGVKLSFALAQLLKVDIGDQPLPPDPDTPLSAESLSVFRAELTDLIIPALDDEEALRRAHSLVSYAEHFEAVDRYGSAIREADLADMTQLLGSRPSNAEEGLRMIADRSVRAPEMRKDLLRYSMRCNARRAHLWPSTLDRARAPLWSISALGL